MWTQYRLSTPPDHHMHRRLAGDMLGHLITEPRPIDAGEQILPLAEQGRRHGEMQLVDGARLQILADGGDAAADADVAAGGGLARAIERFADAAGDEMEDRAALHLERRALGAGGDENGGVVGRLIAPPAAPALVQPRAADRAEHVAAEDPGAGILEAARREAVVDAGRAALLAEHRPEGARREGPLVQRLAADAERILEILVRPGAVAVDGDAEGVHPDSRHRCLSPIGRATASGAAPARQCRAIPGARCSPRREIHDEAQAPQEGRIDVLLPVGGEDGEAVEALQALEQIADLDIGEAVVRVLD